MSRLDEFLKSIPRVPTGTVHDAPDGGDRELQDAADALAEEAGDLPYSPPLPVPITRQTQRPDGMRGQGSEVWLVNPPAALPGNGNLVAGGVAEKGSQFTINSIRVDNFTRQWLYFPEIGSWVPPLWFGRVFRSDGGKIQRVRFETPAGLTAFPLSTSEVARVVFSNENWAEVDGEQIQSGVVPGVSGSVAITGDAGQAQTQAYSADALSQTLLGLITNARLQAWDSGTSTVDRVRSGGTSDSSTASVPNTGILKEQTYLSFSTGNVAPWGSAAALADGLNGTANGAIAQFSYIGAGGGSLWDRVRTAKVFKTFGPLAVAASSIATVWTPATGLKPRLMGFLVNQTSNSTTAGMATFFDNTTTGAVLGATGWLTPPNSLVASAPSMIRLDNGPIVSVSSSIIIVYSPTALSLAGMVFGTEE